MAVISIEGLNKAVLLSELYNASKPLGLGVLHFTPENMTVEQAQKLIDNQPPGLRFDYIQGRVMKIDVTGDITETSGYNRDNGYNAAELIIEKLRKV